MHISIYYFYIIKYIISIWITQYYNKMKKIKISDQDNTMKRYNEIMKLWKIIYIYMKYPIYLRNK